MTDHKIKKMYPLLKQTHRLTKQRGMPRKHINCWYNALTLVCLLNQKARGIFCLKAKHAC